MALRGKISVCYFIVRVARQPTSERPAVRPIAGCHSWLWAAAWRKAATRLLRARLLNLAGASRDACFEHAADVTHGGNAHDDDQRQTKQVINGGSAAPPLMSVRFRRRVCQNAHL